MASSVVCRSVTTPACVGRGLPVDGTMPRCLAAYAPLWAPCRSFRHCQPLSRHPQGGGTHHQRQVERAATGHNREPQRRLTCRAQPYQILPLTLGRLLVFGLALGRGLGRRVHTGRVCGDAARCAFSHRKPTLPQAPSRGPAMPLGVHTWQQAPGCAAPPGC